MTDGAGGGSRSRHIAERYRAGATSVAAPATATLAGRRDPTTASGREVERHGQRRGPWTRRSAEPSTWATPSPRRSAGCATSPPCASPTTRCSCGSCRCTTPSCPADDVDDRKLDDIYAVAVAHLALGRVRRAAAACVARVLSPDRERDGWHSPHSVAARRHRRHAVPRRHRCGWCSSGAGCGIHLLVHPMLRAVRDDADRLVDVGAGLGRRRRGARGVDADRDRPHRRRRRRPPSRPTSCAPSTTCSASSTTSRRCAAGWRRSPASTRSCRGWPTASSCSSAPPTTTSPPTASLTLRAGQRARPRRRRRPGDRPRADAGRAAGRRSPAPTTRRRSSGTSARPSSPSTRAGGRAAPLRRAAGDERLPRQRARHPRRRRTRWPTPSTSARRACTPTPAGPRAPCSRTCRATSSSSSSRPRWPASSSAIVGLQERQLVRVFEVPRAGRPVGHGARVPAARPLHGRAARARRRRRRPRLRRRPSARSSRDVGASSLARIAVSVRCGRRRPVASTSTPSSGRSTSCRRRGRTACGPRSSPSVGEERARDLFDRVGAARAAGVRRRRRAGAGDRRRPPHRRPARRRRRADHRRSATTSTPRPASGASASTAAARRPRCPSCCRCSTTSALQALDERPYTFRARRPSGSTSTTSASASPTRRRPRRAAPGRAAGGVHASSSRARSRATASTASCCAPGSAPARSRSCGRYGKYLRQIGFAFSQRYIEDTLAAHPRSSPTSSPCSTPASTRPRRPTATTLERAAAPRPASGSPTALDAIPSLDDDRICRAFLTLIDATVRTNYYRGRPAIAVKLDPAAIPELPLPRPQHEIWVCGPRVEGVHLRGGADRPRRAALERPPGGLPHRGARADEGPDGEERGDRADRRQGRLRRQAPAGRPRGAAGRGRRVLPGVHPRPARPHRQPRRRAPTAARRAPAGHRRPRRRRHLPRRRRRQGHGDVQRHRQRDRPRVRLLARRRVRVRRQHRLRPQGDGHHGPRRRGRACAATPACSARTPTATRSPPSASATCPATCSATGCCARGRCASSPRSTTATCSSTPTPIRRWRSPSARRLFALPRSSWADYDAALLSPGGGVYPRTLKSIELSPQARAVLGAPDRPLTPNELVSIVLRAPVDLLWNGGIGTYVKASSETNADVGDRANDGVRVNGDELRCRMVGEGGNLGLTQLGRVEYALAGGLVYTDAIDNSAGVDCSDHEVNIKILLDGVVDAGELTDQAAQRAAGVDDRRRRRPRARRQRGPDARPRDRPPPGAADGQRARPLHRPAGDRGLARPRPRVPADRQADRRAPGGRGRAAGAGVRRAHRLHEERQRRRGRAQRPARRRRCSSATCSPTSRPSLRERYAGAIRRTRCAARSSPPGSSTRWSTCRGSRSTTA